MINFFCKMSSWHTRGILAVNGFLREDGSPVSILNVYAPCLSNDRIILWDIISNYLSSYGSPLICVMGDFNAIRNPNKRSGRGSNIDRRDIDTFNEFIAQNNLFEIPIRGRFFTWYRKDGSCKSKLDRMLVNDEWLNSRPNFSLRGGSRSFSDHCPSFVELEKKD